jgi:hypothetical protein
MDLVRNCPKCNNILKYKKKHSLKKAIKNNTLCKICTNSSADRCKKLSNARKNYLNKLSDEDKQHQILKMKNTLVKLWSNKSEDELNIWRKIVSSTTIERNKNKEYRKKVSESVKKTHWSKHNNSQDIINKILKTRIKKYNTNYFTGRCKKTIISGIECNSKYEVKYINYLIDNKLKLPINSKTIKTPYGTYTPDFEFEESFIEVKSNFTYDVLMGVKSYSKTKKSNEKQLHKIKWVNRMIIIKLTRCIYLK